MDKARRLRRLSRPFDLQRIPALPGAYRLDFELDQPLVLEVGRLGQLHLRAGQWHYCGSAKGSGGLRARLARHIRCADEGVPRAHWHVDALLGSTARLACVGYLPGGDEHQLVQRLLRQGKTAPWAGFGSSDCARCRAHLLYAQ